MSRLSHKTLRWPRQSKPTDRPACKAAARNGVKMIAMNVAAIAQTPRNNPAWRIERPMVVGRRPPLNPATAVRVAAQQARQNAPHDGEAPREMDGRPVQM